MRYILYIIVFILSSCTGYHPMSSTGGYEDFQIDKDKYIVKANGNGYTDYKRVVDIAKRRCAEICLDKGYSKFRFMDSDSDTNTSTSYISTPNTTQHYGTYNSYGGNVSSYGSYSGYSTSTSYQPISVSRHSVKYMIQCINDESFGEDVNNILDITKYLEK